MVCVIRIYIYVYIHISNVDVYIFFTEYMIMHRVIKYYI